MKEIFNKALNIANQVNESLARYGEEIWKRKQERGDHNYYM